VPARGAFNDEEILRDQLVPSVSGICHSDEMALNIRNLDNDENLKRALSLKFLWHNGSLIALQQVFEV